MKQSGKPIEKFINKDIKVGDTVYLKDGSALTDIKGVERYIVHAYKDITGIDLPLKQIPAEVIEIDQQYACDGYSCYYLQDIKIKVGKGLFRTASKFVFKPEKKVTSYVIIEFINIP